jgi:Spy/CpxP family protein refolding chaperone
LTSVTALQVPVLIRRRRFHLKHDTVSKSTKGEHKMKRQLTVLVTFTMLLGSALFCQAMPGQEKPEPPGCDHRTPPDHFSARLARILELTEAQTGKIQAILEEERVQAKAQHLKEEELRQQLRQFESGAAFDEQAVRKLTSSLAGIHAEMLFQRLKTHSRVTGVLTPAQRALAERLHQVNEERQAGPCGGEPGERRHPDERRGPGPMDDGDWR